MSAWTIYWFTRLDNIEFVATILSVFFLLGYIGLTIVYYVFKDDKYNETEFKNIKNIRRLVFIVLIISLPTAVFTPSSKEFAAIYLIPKIVNNEQVQQIPSKGLDLLNAKLDQWLDDLRKEKKEK